MSMSTEKPLVPYYVYYRVQCRRQISIYNVVAMKVKATIPPRSPSPLFT